MGTDRMSCRVRVRAGTALAQRLKCCRLQGSSLSCLPAKKPAKAGSARVSHACITGVPAETVI